MTTTFDATSVAGSLAAFGGLPDWLAAGMDAPRLCAALERQVPELRDGRLRLLGVLARPAARQGRRVAGAVHAPGRGARG